MARKGLFSSIGHAAVIATVAAVTLTAVVPAVAETGPSGKGLSGAPATRDATDFSVRRRVHRGVAGTGVAIATSQNRGAHDDGDWRCSPVYCGPYYYGGDRYYRGSGHGTPIFVVPDW